MFKNKTAWFSDSVRSDISRFWVSQGGAVACWKTADYLFSDDASCPDTSRSDEYAKDRATVFHSAYLCTCRLRKSAGSVPLGHYLLPPAPVQNGALSRCRAFGVTLKEVGHGPDVRGYVHIDQLKKFSGELRDFLPSHSGCSVSRPRRGGPPDHC